MKKDVIIAGRPLSEFDAKMHSYPKFDSCQIDAEIFQGADRSSFYLLKNRRGGRTMTCYIDFFGADGFRRTLHQSSFEALFLGSEPVVMDIGDGFFYKAALISSKTYDTVGSVLTMQYQFQVTRHTARVSAEVIPNDSIHFCASNVAKTDCVICLPYTGYSDGENYLIRLGKLSWQLPERLTGDLVLDGERKIFLMGSENVTNRIIWEDFPYLTPGKNTIKVSIGGIVVTTAALTLSYTPTYL